MGLGQMSTSTCKQRCQQKSSCDCITMYKGSCFLRKQCQISKCNGKGGGDVYIHSGKMAKAQEKSKGKASASRIARQEAKWQTRITQKKKRAGGPRYENLQKETAFKTRLAKRALKDWKKQRHHEVK